MPATKKAKGESDELRPEYDFSGAARGKYANRFARETNVIVLAPDVAKAFKGSKAVNNALRSQLSRRSARRTGRKVRP